MIHQGKKLAKKMNFTTLGLMSLTMFFISCGNIEQLKPQSEYFELRNVVFDTTGYKLNPGKSLVTPVKLKKYAHSIKRSIRVTGASILPESLGKRGETAFRKYIYRIDDYLDSKDTYANDPYALVFEGENETYDKNAFYRLSLDQLDLFKGKKVKVEFPVKSQINNYGPKGFFKLKLHLYKKKKDRNIDDIFDEADDIWELEVPAGNTDWEVLTKDLEIPQDIATILVQITSRDMSGVGKVGTPYFKSENETLRFYPIQPYKGLDDNQENWIGENLSSKEWPEFEFAIDGKPFYTGKIFDRASEVGEFDVDLPELPAGSYELSIKLQDSFPASYPFLLKAVEVHENSARDFEVVFTPKLVTKNNKFGILIEVNKPGIKLSFSGDEHIVPELNEKQFNETGLHTLVFNTGEAGLNQKLNISDGTNEVEANIEQILSKKPDSVYISTGDDIYITRSKKQWSKYLKWYMREGIGNMYCWRPSHQWSGAIGSDPEFYGWAVGMLQDLQMPYAFMTEGRTLPGRDINPDIEVVDSPFFMGKQSHEDDGCFYYWLHFGWEGLYSDVAAKYRPYGGIFAKTRPIKKADETFVFYDPYVADDMEQGAQQFINNLSQSRGESIRHTGPSTMFRYFFQAGYQWVGAEQMYGPEELIMSSVRGASKAYGQKSFGTHLATQWSSKPFNTTDHATRLFLSLAVSYIHGATDINTEEGLWNVEEGLDRYTEEGKAHIKSQNDLFQYIQTHERRGNPVVPVAIMQGRNDGWKSFDFSVKSNIWGQRGDEWKYGAPEESFELIKTFYPNNKLGYIGLGANEPREPKGYYSATPFGLVDLLPIEAPQKVLDDYEVITFLGWNTYQQDDFERLLSFVKKGKTLLLTGNHANTELKRNRSTQYPENDEVLVELLGKDYKNKKEPYINKVGKGEVIFYPQKLYPSEYPIKESYTNNLKKLLENSAANQWQKGWIEGAENIEFAAWDWEDSLTRTIYLLNIDWWSTKTSHPATLRIGDDKFSLDIRRNVLETVTISQGIAVIPQSMTTDVLNISKTEKGYEISVQTTDSESITVYNNKNGLKTYELDQPGIHNILID